MLDPDGRGSHARLRADLIPDNGDRARRQVFLTPRKDTDIRPLPGGAGKGFLGRFGGTARHNVANISTVTPAAHGQLAIAVPQCSPRPPASR